MVVPLYKRLEASLARILIIHDDATSTTQLVAVLEDFSLGRCMNFVLRSTDAFEPFSKSGKHYIRLVDAKFAMPKSEREAGWRFVCLDTPMYPAEHDDVVVGFESEEGELLLLFFGERG